MRKIKLISIDVDGCLVAYKNIESYFQSSWDALAYAYGLKEKWDKRIEEFYMKKEDDLKWASMNASDLKNKPLSIAEKFLYPIPYSSGARYFAELSKGKIIRGLLTTAIDLVAEKAKHELEMDFAFYNTLHKHNGCFTGFIDYAVPIWRKHERIDDLCRNFNISPKEICHVGDNENDTLVGNIVGLFIAFNPKKEEVAKKAKYVIHDFKDLIKILDLK
jgi:phosphoserine phosphatase